MMNHLSRSLTILAFCLLSLHLSFGQWQKVNGPTGGTVQCLSIFGNTMIAGDYLGIFRSTNQGANWTTANDTLYLHTVVGSGGGDSLLLAGTYSGLFYSRDTGRTWSLLGLSGYDVNSILVSDSEILVSISDGILLSSDKGTTWTERDSGINGHTGILLARCDSKLFAGTTNGLFSSNNMGRTWDSVHVPRPNGNLFTIHSIFVQDSNIYLGAYGMLIRSIDGGNHWILKNEYFGDDTYSLFIRGDTICVGTESGVVVSTNDGATWYARYFENQMIYSLAFSDTSIFVGTFLGGVLSISINGVNQTELNTGLQRLEVFALQTSSSDSVGTILVGTNNGAYRSTDDGTTWSHLGFSRTYINSFTLLDSTFFAGTGYGLFRTTNNGKHWDTVYFTNGLTFSVETILQYGATLYVGTAKGIYMSSDRGATWNSRGLTGEYILSLLKSDSLLLAGTLTGLYRSTNSGNSWQLASSPSQWNPYGCLIQYRSVLFAGSTYEGMWRSYDSGESWDSVNNGFSGNKAIIKLAANGTALFTGTGGGRIYHSSNQGNNWIRIDSGEFYHDVRCLAISGTDLLAGSQVTGLWRRPLAEITGISSPETHKPAMTELQQNWPNPFNPSTQISFSLPTASHVRLTISNILGQTIATLVEGAEQPGIHLYQWNAASFSSGIYFYKLESHSVADPTRTYTSVRKMVLIK